MAAFVRKSLYPYSVPSFASSRALLSLSGSSVVMSVRTLEIGTRKGCCEKICTIFYKSCSQDHHVWRRRPRPFFVHGPRCDHSRAGRCPTHGLEVRRGGFVPVRWTEPLSRPLFGLSYKSHSGPAAAPSRAECPRRLVGDGSAPPIDPSWHSHDVYWS